ncbi:MAG: hypothetical protein MUE69_21210 [Myxococcota bacterium]|jgi:hypothetical protein|nr:hypothetical protein [Myxococcota bacterium]
MMRSTIFLMALAIGAGCAGEESDAVSAASSAYVGHAEPLLRVEPRLWNNAPAGCEGRLGAAELRWGVASGAPELVVAMLNGIPLCVDTYSAVESELAAIDSPALDGLWAGYVTTLQELEPQGTAFPDNAAPEVEYRAVAAGDPHPNPSDPRAGEPVGLPSLGLGLEPRLGGVLVEPTPQPSAPDPTTSSASAGSSTSTNTTTSTGTGTPAEGTSPSMGAPRDDPRRP